MGVFANDLCVILNKCNSPAGYEGPAEIVGGKEYNVMQEYNLQSLQEVKQTAM